MKIKKICAAVMATVIAGIMLVATAMADVGTGSDATVTGTTGYIAVKIFDADINEDGTISNVDWTSDSIKTSVLEGLKEVDGDMNLTNAQEVAEYIRENFAESGETSSATTILESTASLSAVARKLSTAFQGTTEDGDYVKLLEPGVKKKLSEGYWLVFTQSSTLETGEEGTAPIYMVMSSAANGDITVNEKVTQPVWGYEIQNDDGTWGKKADLHYKQKATQKMTFTLPSNLANFTKYYLTMLCKVPTGCAIDSGNVKVKIGENDITSKFKISYVRSMLAVTSEDILGNGYQAGDTIEVTFDSWLTTGFKSGKTGNRFTSYAAYSGNPVDAEIHTQTVEKAVYLYAYDLQVVKKDRETNVPLEGAVFTLQATNPDDSASSGKYVAADGQLSDTAVQLSTGADGTLDIPGLDVGTYVLTEVTAPAGYQFAQAATTIQITAAYDDDGVATQIGNQVSGNSDAIAGLDSTDDDTMDADANSAVSENGKVYVTVGNIEKILLPVTGQEGIVTLSVIGCVVIALSALMILLLRKKKQI